MSWSSGWTVALLDFDPPKPPHYCWVTYHDILGIVDCSSKAHALLGQLIFPYNLAGLQRDRSGVHDEDHKSRGTRSRECNGTCRDARQERELGPLAIWSDSRPFRRYLTL